MESGNQDQDGKHILQSLERIDASISALNEKMVEIQIEFATIKAKTGLLWGILGAGAGIAIALIVQSTKQGMG